MQKKCVYVKYVKIVFFVFCKDGLVSKQVAEQYH